MNIDFLVKLLNNTESKIMERRTFIRNGALAGSGLFAFSGLEAMVSDISKSRTMPYATLGRTGVKVSKLGLGCAPLGIDSLDPLEANRIVAKAFSDGVTYFDSPLCLWIDVKSQD